MIKNRFVQKLLIFLIGGFLYCIIEVLFRGYSHFSMLMAGGICFSFINNLISTWGSNFNILHQMLISTIFITIVEYITGVIVNIQLNLNVWDYSLLPFNYRGQICLLFMFLWFILSYIAIILNKYININLFV